MSHEHHPPALPWYKRRNNQVLLILVAVGGVYLLVEHWAHAAPYLPWLILLACPLMHVFMHGGHGHGAHGSAPGGGPSESRRPDDEKGTA